MYFRLTEINYIVRLLFKFYYNVSMINYKLVFMITIVPYNTIKIKHACNSKYNTNRKNQVILLMITDGKKWNYLAVKSCLHYLDESHQNMREAFIA